MMRRALVAVAAAASASCGAALLKLPVGPGRPAPDAAAIVADATTACRAVTTMTAVIAVSGSVGGRRLRGRLLAGLAPPASARLEAAAPFGAPIFILVARNDTATLLLPRDNRVLEDAPSERVLEAIAGVPIGAAGLRVALTGCAATPMPASGRSLGDDWRVVSDGSAELYLRREAGAWRLVAALHHDPQGEWRAEYRDFDRGLPRTIRFVSADPTRFDLRLALSQVDLNVPLGDEAFSVRVPPTARPITLAELQASGPLAPESNGP